jgi:2-oxoglutarate ferredoxin oxidoreductase subunit alpha
LRATWRVRAQSPIPPVWRRGRSGCRHPRRHLREDLQPARLHLNAYNAYQSIIRGGHTFLTIRTGPDKVSRHGRRHRPAHPAQSGHHGPPSPLLTAGGACIYNADTIKPGTPAEGVQLCPLPSHTGRHQPQQGRAEHARHGRRPQHDGRRLPGARSVLAEQFRKKGEAVVEENVAIARAGYDYATKNFKPFAWPSP